MGAALSPFLLLVNGQLVLILLAQKAIGNIVIFLSILEPVSFWFEMYFPSFFRTVSQGNIS